MHDTLNHQRGKPEQVMMEVNGYVFTWHFLSRLRLYCSCLCHLGRLLLLLFALAICLILAICLDVAIYLDVEQYHVRWPFISVRHTNYTVIHSQPHQWQGQGNTIELPSGFPSNKYVVRMYSTVQLNLSIVDTMGPSWLSCVEKCP